MLDNNRTELVLYIARQVRIVYGAQQFSEWIVVVFLIFVIYSYYRNRSERKFILTVSDLQMLSNYRPKDKPALPKMLRKFLSNGSMNMDIKLLHS